MTDKKEILTDFRLRTGTAEFVKGLTKFATDFKNQEHSEAGPISKELWDKLKNRRSPFYAKSQISFMSAPLTEDNPFNKRFSGYFLGGKGSGRKTDPTLMNFIIKVVKKKEKPNDR